VNVGVVSARLSQLASSFLPLSRSESRLVLVLVLSIGGWAKLQGAYRDDNGKPVVLDCVRQAESRIAGNLNMSVRSPSYLLLHEWSYIQQLGDPVLECTRDSRMASLYML
jgi:hypothetical protein